MLGAARRLKSYNLADFGRLSQCTIRRESPFRPRYGLDTVAGGHAPADETTETNLKLHQDSSGALNTVTGYGAHYVDVNLVRHESSILLLPDTPVQAWPVTAFDALAPEHFELVLEQTPELVVFGSGARLRFPHPRLTAALAARRIGVETMDFMAACRTYNILMAEGRRVAAALLIER